MNKTQLSRFGLALAAALVSLGVAAAHFDVDFGTVTGPVKPVNGVGQPPMIGLPSSAPMFHYLKEAAVPYARLHDVGGPYGGGRYVDIPNIFRNFEADENDPKSYSFAFTDALMKELEKNGVEPFFRLGVTIDNPVDKGFPGYYIDPPADFAKWARVCEHVIRHYTEGWANGFRMKVTYWEIWNEPDNNPDQSRNPLWNAPFSEYIRFYGVVAPYLKAKFPHLKIGGYASCGFYAGVGSGQEKSANSSPRTAYFVACAKEFLGAVRDGKWPLDFFSYHSYSAPDEALRQVRYADKLLDLHGFTADRCERIFNEWLPYANHDNLGSALQAAGIAAELIGLQNGPCDVACLYDARCGIGNYSPLFNPLTYKPHKAYSALALFGELRKYGSAVRLTTDGTKGFHACAAKGEKGAAILFANDTDGEIEVCCDDLCGYRVDSVRYTDATHTDATLSAEEIPSPALLPPHSFALLRLR